MFTVAISPVGRYSLSRIRGGAIVINIKRVVMWSGITLASVVMLLIAIYKVFWLLAGTLAWGAGPLSGFYVAGLMEAPAYLASAATAWWPWVVESVAGLTLVVIFARFNPWTISPFQRGLSLEYVFVIAANVAFFAKISLRRAEMKSA
jgi:hypothetical protein